MNFPQSLALLADATLGPIYSDAWDGKQSEVDPPNRAQNNIPGQSGPGGSKGSNWLRWRPKAS
jgi:hypothetical protein